MSFSRTLPPKNNGASAIKPTLPKGPSRQQSKRSKVELSSIPNQEDLDDIIK
jgi:hypothetical protein